MRPAFSSRMRITTHYSPDDIRRVMRDDTTFVAPHDVCEKLAVDFPGAKLREVAAGDMPVLLRDWD